MNDRVEHTPPATMETVASKIQDLGDLELAILLSLVAEQHCIITTKSTLVESLARELQLISTRVFNVSCAFVNCSASTTLDEFREGVLVDVPADYEEPTDFPTPLNSLPSFQHLTPRHSLFRNQSGVSNSLDERRVANIIIANNLNLASHTVQTQALELIRTKRLFSHTAMHAASKDFLFVALQAFDSARLTRHLNDLFAISHHHFAEDGFPNLEEMYGDQSGFDDAASVTSVIQTPSGKAPYYSLTPTISHSDIKYLRHAASQARMSAEVAAYLHNITIFMRLSRYIAGGVTALATKHFRVTVQALAPLHDLTYCPPSLVALAARKIYPHRIVLATTKTERSLQWGSDSQVVQELLESMTAEDAIEDTLNNVEAPL